MWKNIVQPDRPQMTIWRMRIACWITKATKAYSEYVIFMLVHRYNACTNKPKCSIIPTSLVLFVYFNTTLVLPKGYLKIPPVAEPTGIPKNRMHGHVTVIYYNL